MVNGQLLHRASCRHSLASPPAPPPVVVQHLVSYEEANRVAQEILSGLVGATISAREYVPASLPARAFATTTPAQTRYEHYAKLGSAGGTKASARMSPLERHQRAVKAANARWRKS
jgi:hypothetical protein